MSFTPVKCCNNKNASVSLKYPSLFTSAFLYWIPYVNSLPFWLPNIPTFATSLNANQTSDTVTILL